MKRLFYLLLSALAVACSGYEIIPDDQLALIFHDAYLANAYLQQQGAKPDSVNIYEPIFARYGYTTADVQYTIGNFSKRKSARLSDVVERAIEMLDREGLMLDREVAILDTIDNVAQRTFRRTIHADSLIRVRRLDDTTRLRFTFDGIRPGSYLVSYDYLVDSLDENFQLRASMWFEGEGDRRIGFTQSYLSRYRESELRRELHADTSARRLVMNLYDMRDAKRKRPRITLRNLRVTYTPDAADAVDSLFLRQLNLKIFADDLLFPPYAQDSVALSADTLGVAAAPAGDAR